MTEVVLCRYPQGDWPRWCYDALAAVNIHLPGARPPSQADKDALAAADRKQDGGQAGMAQSGVGAIKVKRSSEGRGEAEKRPKGKDDKEEKNSAIAERLT